MIGAISQFYLLSVRDYRGLKQLRKRSARREDLGIAMEHVTTATADTSPDVAVVSTTLGAQVEQEAALGADSAEQISAFEQILQRFEDNTLTERDKGTAFELLVRDVFSSAQPWCEQFEQVQTYADWAKEHPELTGGDARDTGIDLVATNRVLEVGQNAGSANQIRIENRGGG